MRISDNNLNFQFNSSMVSNNVKLNKTTEQISTQSTINRFSDDPIGAIQLESLNKQTIQNSQYIENSKNVLSSLGKYESFVDSILELGNQINEQLLQGANETIDDSARSGIVTEVETLKEEMVQMLNKQDEGHYLFSGTNSKTLAVDNSSGSYVITGNGETRQSAVGEGVTVGSNFTVQDLFNNVDFLNDIDSALEEMTSSTPDFSNIMKTAINSTQAAIEGIQSGLSELGSRMNTAQRQQATSEDLNFFSEQMKMQLTQVDNAQASYTLTQTKAAIEMTQKAFTTIRSSSMFDYL
ncbi:hypothetical protein [Vibrio rumoiensis]|uniref:flagellin N-terminal helical domain-containing protein n=1 Tax=Vibrio rumoiensis TaxID=76258 RepID=UPI003AA9A361